MGPDAMILVFLIFSFKPALSLSSFTLIRGSLFPLHFLPWEWHHLHYLKLLMFLPPILIPACNSSSPAFLMMCSVYRLNKRGDSRLPCRTPFSILNQSVGSIQGSNCYFLTHIQVSQETGKIIWYSHLSKSFLQFVMIHIVKGLLSL